MESIPTPSPSYCRILEVLNGSYESIKEVIESGEFKLIDLFIQSKNISQIELTKFLYSLFTVDELIKHTSTMADYNWPGSMCLILYGTLENLQQLLSLNVYLSVELFHDSCARGNLEFAKCIYDFILNERLRSTFPKVELSETEECLKFVSRCFVSENFGIKDSGLPLPEDKKSNVFISACEYGHLDVVKWLSTLNGLYFNVDNGVAFYLAAYNGHLEILKYLYSLGKFDINSYDYPSNKSWIIDHDNNYERKSAPFRAACCRGHLEIAQWLYSLEKECIGIHVHSGTEEVTNQRLRYTFITKEINVQESIFEEVFVELFSENGLLPLIKWLVALPEIKSLLTPECMQKCYTEALDNATEWYNEDISNGSIKDWITEFMNTYEFKE